MTYVGWLRIPPGHWRAVCEGKSEDEVWRHMVALKPPGVRDLEKAVLPEGKHPSKYRKKDGEA